MKHLLTAIACCLAVAGSAQTPYNPDSNGDNFIGSHDLLDFLPLYDSPFFASDAIVIQTVDSVSIVDTCLYQDIPYLISGISDSLCTSYSGDSIAQTVFEPYAGTDVGDCYVYHWYCWDNHQIPVVIDESTDWVDWQVGYSFDLPADSSWKTLCFAKSGNSFGGLIYSDGEFLGNFQQGVGGSNYMSPLVIFVRDYKGTWFWQR